MEDNCKKCGAKLTVKTNPPRKYCNMKCMREDKAPKRIEELEVPLNGFNTPEHWILIRNKIHEIIRHLNYENQNACPDDYNNPQSED